MLLLHIDDDKVNLLLWSAFLESDRWLVECGPIEMHSAALYKIIGKTRNDLWKSSKKVFFLVHLICSARDIFYLSNDQIRRSMDKIDQRWNSFTVWLSPWVKHRFARLNSSGNDLLSLFPVRSCRIETRIVRQPTPRTQWVTPRPAELLSNCLCFARMNKNNKSKSIKLGQ